MNDFNFSKTPVSQSPSSKSSSSPSKDNRADSSSKEKKILPGRRQQRHSTEIGSEYHRWWVVRNAMGSETNEHIAGLLLDGFHALLHQLVQTCGAETYHGISGKAAKDEVDLRTTSGQLSSPSTSYKASFTTSPPGVIDDMDDFMEYKSAITYYCDGLWQIYGQQDGRLPEFEGKGQPVQDFLLKLMSYLRAARGKTYKKKKLKTSCCSNVSSGKTKGATRNDSDESDFSNDEDLTTSEQYEEQYLKMLLNKSSSSEDYNTQVTNNDPGQINKEPTSPTTKLDIDPVTDLTLVDQTLVTDLNSVEDQNRSLCGNQLKKVNENKSLDSCPSPTFSLDQQPQGVRIKKLTSKINSSKFKTSATSSVGTNTLNFAEIRPHSSKPKSLHSRQNSEFVSKTIEQCTGLDLALKPTLPVAVDNPQGVSTTTTLGTPVILYPANSFPPGDSSLASLSSLIQNIVCNSHGAIMKPLSSAPTYSSNATCTPPEMVAHTSSCDNNICHGSVAAALPVLSSRLNAAKKTLVPFHISHMNSVNKATKQNTSFHASFKPSQTSTPKPIQPYLPMPRPIQPSLSTHYHGWSTMADKTSQSSSMTSSLQLLLNSSSGPPCLETRAYSKNETINYQAMFPDKPTLNHPPINISTSIYSNNFNFPTSSSTTNSVDLNYTSSKHPATKNPHKKILTSLLSSKTINYKGSSLSAPDAGNSFDSRNVESAANQDDKCSTLTSLPSPSCVSSARDSVNLEPSLAKKKRLDKSRSRFVCSSCDLLFYSGTDLLVHRYEQHSHVCGECDGRFLSVARLKQHKESDHPVLMICSLCRFHTFNKQGLIDHQRLEHCFEKDSTGDKSTNSEVIKVLSNTNISDGQLQPVCNNETSSPPSSNNSPVISVSSIKGNEKVDVSVGSVNMVKSLEISTDIDHKPASSLCASNHSSQIELKHNHTVFLSRTSEQVARENCDLSPANTLYESCNVLHSGDQLYSDESDDPKLVIDTDL